MPTELCIRCHRHAERAGRTNQKIRVGKEVGMNIQTRWESGEMGMIVITNMESLPEYCYECPCHDGESGYCQADKERRYSLEYRPFWCPLKEIHDDQEGR